MIIDTYTVAVNFRVNQQSLRNVDRALRNIQNKARNIGIALNPRTGGGVGGGVGGGGGGNNRHSSLGTRLGGIGTAGFNPQIGIVTGALNGYALAAAGVGVAAYKTVKQSAIMEQALIAVAKVTDLSDKELEKLKGTALELASTTVGAGPERLLAYAEAAGTMGFKTRQELEKVMETMGRLEMATPLAGFDAAQTISRILQLSGAGNEDFDRFGSTMVQLANERRTTEKQILDTARYVAQGTVQYDVAADQVLGLAAAFSELATRPENARTNTQRALEAVTVAASDAESAQASTIRKLTGLSQEEIGAAYTKDKVKLVLLMAKGINRVNEENQLFVKSKGMEGKQYDMEDIYKSIKMNDNAIKATLNTVGAKYDIFIEDLKIASKEFATNTALIKESDKASSALIVKVGQLGSRFKELADVIIGRDVLSVLGTMTDMLNYNLKQVIDIISAFKQWYAEMDAVPDFMKDIANWNAQRVLNNKAESGEYSDEYIQNEQRKLDRITGKLEAKRTAETVAERKEIIVDMESTADRHRKALNTTMRGIIPLVGPVLPQAPTEIVGPVEVEPVTASDWSAYAGYPHIPAAMIDEINGTAPRGSATNSPPTAPIITNSGNTTVHVNVNGTGPVNTDDVRAGARQGVIDANKSKGISGGFRGQTEMFNTLKQALGGA